MINALPAINYNYFKESDQEEYKRKLFFGRLADNTTAEKVVHMIEGFVKIHIRVIHESFIRRPFIIMKDVYRCVLNP